MCTILIPRDIEDITKYHWMYGILKDVCYKSKSKVSQQYTRQPKLYKSLLVSNQHKEGHWAASLGSPHYFSASTSSGATKKNIFRLYQMCPNRSGEATKMTRAENHWDEDRWELVFVAKELTDQ